MHTDNHFDQLPVWKQTMDFVRLIYAATNTFPAEEKDGLGRRLRNKAIDLAVMVSSVPGAGINTASVRNLTEAGNAVRELETLLYISTQLGFLKPAEYEKYAEETSTIGRELHRMASRMNKKIS
ncbi:MAG TPA: four helix bundle protein [Bacteroidales bacterium]|nr:four helix bundle protein [Bacteroidales bacterium]